MSEEYFIVEWYEAEKMPSRKDMNLMVKAVRRRALKDRGIRLGPFHRRKDVEREQVRPTRLPTNAVCRAFSAKVLEDARMRRLDETTPPDACPT